MTLAQFIENLEYWRDMREGNEDLPVLDVEGGPVEAIASMSQVIVRRIPVR